jgi:uncharacterized protein YndB with AHSA1/START domain
METKTQHGYLVLADISGYTSFLAKTELEHAHEILTELLELIVSNFKPVLTLSKLEGDAVFAYAPESKVARGEMLIELIEATYLAFRDRLLACARRTTCTCNACRAIPSLDLKFFTHHGDFIFQNVSGITELVGSDVNLVHRLMKNHITENTGWRGYALFTDDCLEHMCVLPEGMHSQVENYEHLGDVQTCSMDLHVRYKDLTEERHVIVTAEEADGVVFHDLSAPPAIVWDWLNDPHKRNVWMGAGQWSAAMRPGGRTGVGARNHCAHGKSVAVENFLDWRPFSYYTVEYPDMPGMSLRVTLQLTPMPGGTRIEARMKVMLKMPLPRPVVRAIAHTMMNKMFQFKPRWQNMGRLIAAEASGAPLPEPAMAHAMA